MTRSSETVSVVICTHAAERWGDLEAAVRSVQQQTFAASQIIVVVDHNEALLGLVKDRLPEVTALENRGRTGENASRNVGLTAATGELAAFLDDDAAAEAEWLERLAESYGGASVLGVGGSIIPSWPEGGSPAWFLDEFNWVVRCTYRGMPEQVAPVRNVIGANMSFRREALTDVGGFRESLGRVGSVSWERVRRTSASVCESGGRLARSSTTRPPRVRHRVSRNRTRWSYFLARCVGEGRSKAILAQLVGQNRALTTEQ